jgi:acyl carrier protein
MTNETIQSAVAKIIEEMVCELELDFDDPIGPQTRLIADLGFASVDFIHLIVELEGHFQRKMGFHDLIMPDDGFADLVAHPPVFGPKLLGRLFNRRIHWVNHTKLPLDVPCSAIVVWMDHS